jgi:hypothetical protein
MRPTRMSLTMTRLVIAVGAVCAVLAQPAIRAGGQAQPAGQPPKLATPRPVPPVFFRETWRQTLPIDASTGFDTERPVTPAAVANSNLELKVYDPGAKDIAAYAKTPPPRSIARDWSGTSCIQLAGNNQNPPPKQVLHGEPGDPVNLWTGACLNPVAATLRDKNNYVDLTGEAKIRWVTRVSGFHVVRPVLKLADGTWLVGDYAEGAHATNSEFFLESEFPIAPIRWLALDMGRIVTRGKWVPTPNLSKVDEVGFADLLPSSGHGWGGFVNLGMIEVHGTPVKR